MNLNHPKRWNALASLCGAALLAATSVGTNAQTLVSTATPAEIISMLGGQSAGGMLARKFSYKPTPAPDALTGRCTTQIAQAKSTDNTRAHRLAAVEPGQDAVYVADADSPGKLDMQINFRTGTHLIQDSSTPLLNSLASALNSPSLSASLLAVVGHTDAQGDHTSEGRRKNLELSCARALAVRQYLMQQGVDGARLGVYGFGSAKPIQQGVTNSEVNRRVEIRRAS